MSRQYFPQGLTRVNVIMDIVQYIVIDSNPLIRAHAGDTLFDPTVRSGGGGHGNHSEKK
jgi:hypothetical protein